MDRAVAFPSFGRWSVFASALIMVLVSSFSAEANGRLPRIIGETFAKYVLIESSEGRALTRVILGREAANTRDLRALAARLDQPGMAPLGAELETRLVRIRDAYHSNRSVRARIGLLSEADRGLLRRLAADELASELLAEGRIQFVARNGTSQSFSVVRSRFLHGDATEAALALRFGNPLAEAFPPTLESGDLSSRLGAFVARHPDQVTLIDNVRFRLPGNTGMEDGRKLLVISVDGLDAQSQGIANLTADYLSAIGRGTVSFPLVEGAGHLYTRLGTQVFDFLHSVNRANYRGSYSGRLEPVIALTAEEQMQLRKFVENAVLRPEETVGRFSYDGVPAGGSRGLLENNLPTRGAHNCTSWITTVRIGEGGTLQELVGGGGWRVNTNPGWWSAFLLSSPSARSRVPFAVYWTTEPIAAVRTRIRSGEVLDWRFNAH